MTFYLQEQLTKQHKEQLTKEYNETYTKLRKQGLTVKQAIQNSRRGRGVQLPGSGTMMSHVAIFHKIY